MVKNLTSKNFYLLSLIGIISGCASTPDMIPPGKIKTTIDIVNLSPNVVTSFSLYADDYNCTGKGNILFFQVFKDSSVETYRLKKFQTFTYQYNAFFNSTAFLCRGTHTFRFDESNHYKVTIQANGSTCAAGVERENMEKGIVSWITVPSVKREYVTPFWENGSFCVPSQNFHGSSVYVSQPKP